MGCDAVTRARTLRVQRRLIELAYLPPGAADGLFGPVTRAAVVHYQSDRDLVPDGVVGPITWASLFPAEAEAAETAARTALRDSDTWTRMFVAVAESQIGVRESGANRGATVERYQRVAGGSPGQPWCMYFVQWCALRAATACGCSNPVRPVTGHVLTFWGATPAAHRFNVLAARAGDILIFDFGGGRGHTGVVTAVANGILTTVEGNTNGTGSREGDGVYRKARKWSLSTLRGVVRPVL